MNDVPKQPDLRDPTSDPRARPRYRLVVTGPSFAWVVPGRFVAVVIVASFVGSTVGVFYAGGWIFQRWAPNLDAVAMTCLATWTWMYHLVELLRRRQPLGRGLARALAYTSLMAVIVIAGSALVAVIGSR